MLFCAEDESTMSEMAVSVLTLLIHPKNGYVKDSP